MAQPKIIQLFLFCQNELHSPSWFHSSNSDLLSWESTWVSWLLFEEFSHSISPTFSSNSSNFQFITKFDSSSNLPDVSAWSIFSCFSLRKSNVLFVSFSNKLLFMIFAPSILRQNQSSSSSPRLSTSILFLDFKTSSIFFEIGQIIAFSKKFNSFLKSCIYLSAMSHLYFSIFVISCILN